MNPMYNETKHLSTESLVKKLVKSIISWNRTVADIFCAADGVFYLHIMKTTPTTTFDGTWNEEVEGMFEHRTKFLVSSTVKVVAGL